MIKKTGRSRAPSQDRSRKTYFFSVEVVAVVAVVVVAVVAEPVAAGASVDVVAVVAVMVPVAVEPVSSTTFGCSVVVVVLVDSLDDSSAFLQAPRNRVAVAIAASRNRARDFFIGRSPSLLNIEFDFFEIRDIPYFIPQRPGHHT
jgi:hypothetical protein